jgi:hypothetical protein
MRRFFLALGVGQEVVTRPLPDVVQPVQGPADRVVGQPAVQEVLQQVAQQGHRPVGVRGAEVLRGQQQEGFQQVLGVLVQRRRASPALRVLQRGGVVAVAVGFDPVVHALPGDAEKARNLCDRPPGVELQDGERPPQEAGVERLGPLAPEALALRRGQVKAAHARSLGWLQHCMSKWRVKIILRTCLAADDGRGREARTHRHP